MLIQVMGTERWEVHKGCEIAPQALGPSRCLGGPALAPQRYVSHTQVRRGKVRPQEREKPRPGSFPRRALAIWRALPGLRGRHARTPASRRLSRFFPTYPSFLLSSSRGQTKAPHLAAALTLSLSPHLASCHSESGFQRSLSRTSIHFSLPPHFSMMMMMAG